MSVCVCMCIGVTPTLVPFPRLVQVGKASYRVDLCIHIHIYVCVYVCVYRGYPSPSSIPLCLLQVGKASYRVDLSLSALAKVSVHDFASFGFTLLPFPCCLV